jgi:hypothetical protein
VNLAATINALDLEKNVYSQDKKYSIELRS